MRSNQKTKKELIQDFLKRMTELGLISDLTGYIFLDPIHVGEKSTEIFERQFIENCARTSGKNPITRMPLSLDDVHKTPPLVKIQDQIEDEIKKFLEENKNHPEIKEIEKAIQAERYQNKPITAAQPQPTQPAQPADPTPDDLLAMGVAVNQVASPATGQGQGLGFFQPLQQQQISWGIDVITADLWNLDNLYDSGGELNRYRTYINLDAVHVSDITLLGYTDGTYGISVYASHHNRNQNGFLVAERDIIHNQQLIQALNNRGFNANTAHVAWFPSINSEFDNVFSMRGSLQDIIQALPELLNCVGDLEGQNSINTIRNEIINSFQQLVPGPAPTF